MAPLLLRAQTLALHPSAIPDLDGTAIECRVQISCDGSPATDKAQGDGSGWAPLSQERTLKFDTKDSRSGHFEFASTAGPLELKVLARRQEQTDAEWIVGVASLGTPAELREKGSSWNEAAVFPPPASEDGRKVGTPSSRAVGALIVKSSVPSAAKVAATGAGVVEQCSGVNSSSLATFTGPAPGSCASATALPSEAKALNEAGTFPAATPLRQSGPHSSDPAASEPSAGSSLLPAEGGAPVAAAAADLERLRRDAEAEEAAVLVAEAELSRLQAELDASRGQTDGLRAELAKAEGALLGTQRADLKAQKLHAVGRQTRALQLELENVHRALAIQLDSAQAEEARLARVRVVTAG